MRVLIACEYSGRVRDAFRALGHDAMSCDLLPTEVEGPHHMGDVTELLHMGWDLSGFDRWARYSEAIRSNARLETMTVIDLAQARADKTPHLSGAAVCLACKHEWVAVALVGTVWMECPACSLERGRYKGSVNVGGDHWHCHCGNDLFHATPTGMYCPNCGEWQHGF